MFINALGLLITVAVDYSSVIYLIKEGSKLMASSFAFPSSLFLKRLFEMQNQLLLVLRGKINDNDLFLPRNNNVI